MGDEQWPDPTKYLFISLEQKRKDQAKPYDGKKMFWIPDDKDCYILGNIESEKGDMVTLAVPGGEKVSWSLHFGRHIPPPTFHFTHTETIFACVNCRKPSRRMPCNN